jgi:hypothetical protein
LKHFPESLQLSSDLCADTHSDDRRQLEVLPPYREAQDRLHRECMDAEEGLPDVGRSSGFFSNESERPVLGSTCILRHNRILSTDVLLSLAVVRPQNKQEACRRSWTGSGASVLIGLKFGYTLHPQANGIPVITFAA